MKKANSRTQREPSRRSLREMPEVDFRTARVTRNPYARRIAAGGLVVQVGRGRPKRLLESGGTTPRSGKPFSSGRGTPPDARSRARGPG